MVRLRVLGGIDLCHDDGAPVDAVLRQPKRAALLTYLAASPGGVPRRRDVIVSMFWPEADDRRGRDSLSAALGFLRRHIGAAAFAARGEEEIGCDPRHVASDVVDFLRCVEDGADEAALALYRGDLLAGFHVRGAPGFEEWLERERSRLRAIAAASATRLTDRAAAAGMAEAAATSARRAAELAPDDETVRRRQISLEAAAGNRAAALRTYEDFAAHLATAYDATPSPETVALAESIRDAGAIQRVARAPVSGAFMAFTPAPPTPPVTPALPREAQESPATTRQRRVTTRSWLRWRPLGALALLVIGFVATFAALDRRDDTTIDRPSLVIVADLSAPDTLLGVTAGAWLRSTLGRAPGVRTLEGAELADALRQMRRDPTRPLDDAVARELAVRQGASGVVTGRITSTDSGHTIGIELVGDDGRVVAHPVARAANAAEVLTALAVVGDRLRESLARGHGSRAALRAVTTPSLVALVAFTEADRLRYNALDPRAAIPYYERAIRLDSTFAMAYAQLAGAYNEMGSAAPSPDTVVKLWRTAMRFADGLGPRELLAINDGMIFAGPGERATKFDRAVRLYQDHLRLYPDDGQALQLLSWYLKHVGRWADSEAPALRALQTGYATPRLYDELVIAQIGLGKFEAAAQSLRAWRERFGPSQLWYRDAFRLAAARRDYAAGDSLTAEAMRDRTWNARPGQLPVITLLVRGRVREAEAVHRAEIASLERNRNHGALIRLTSWFAAMRAGVTGDTAGSLAMLHEALRRYPPASLPRPAVTHVYKDAGRHLALLGDSAGARAMLASLQSNWYIYRLDRNIRGLIDVAGGRHREAIAELREVRYSSGHLPPLGRAYERVGATDSAIAVYERFLVQPDPDAPAWDAVFLIHVLERLGELHESRGERALAAERFGLVAELLQDADPDLQWRARRALRESRKLPEHDDAAAR